MSAYTIISTTNTTYNDPDLGITNGVLVVFRMLAYNERGEVRVPSMDAKVIKEKVDAYVAQRDALAGK